MAEQKKLSAELIPKFYRFDKFRPTPMLSREEVKQLIKIHEFGAHSFSHASMAHETDEFFQADLRNCRDYFLSSLESTVNIYAFPNGSFRQSQLEMARDSGYKHILLVDDKFSKQSAGIHQRFGLEAQSRSELYFRALGSLSPVN